MAHRDDGNELPAKIIEAVGVNLHACCRLGGALLPLTEPAAKPVALLLLPDERGGLGRPAFVALDAALVIAVSATARPVAFPGIATWSAPRPRLCALVALGAPG